MSNKGKGIPIIILITIVLIVALVASGIVLWNKNNSGEKNNKNNKLIKNTSSSESSISYINSKNEDNNKLAFLLKNKGDIEYVLTIVVNKNINLPNNYLYDAYKEKLTIKINDDYDLDVNLNDIKIEIDDDSLNTNDNIIKQNGNWYLAKGSTGNLCIYFKIGDLGNSWKTEWLSFDISNKDLNNINEKYFDGFCNCVNIYKVNDDNENLVFTDGNNKKIDLSDFTFINDNIVKSVANNYKIYLKTPYYINSLESNTISHSLSYSTKKEVYFIELYNSYSYNSDVLKSTRLQDLECNNETYEVYYKESIVSGNYDLIMYRKINDDEYLRIHNHIDDIKDIDNVLETTVKDIL